MMGMTKILIAIVVAMLVYLALLSYKAWRQERKNRALDYLLNGHTPTKKERRQIQNEECILESTIMGMEGDKVYIGKLSKPSRTPKNGDFASEDGLTYFFYDGKWRRIINDMPQIDYRIKYNW